MATSSSRLVIAGLSGDSGKTIATLSTLAALRHRGLTVSIFKKGPDYIDPAWLSLAGGSACRNLDTFMVERDTVRERFIAHADNSHIAVIEGNRGLFDGRDAAGTHSTAELAKLIEAPVVLVASAAKTTRTLAAVVKGALDFDPDVNVAGVILNRVAGSRHLRVISESIERYCRVPVLGAIPNLGDASALIPGRHLGLVTPAEFGFSEALQVRLQKIAEDHLDIDGLLKLADTAGPLSCEPDTRGASETPGRVRIGYFKDSVFTFYYPENLEALERGGAKLVPVSSLADKALPDIDALYIGGGFPETHAAELAQNRSMMDSVKNAATDGLPVYAECGGLIYLAGSLACDDNVYPMTGLFPVDLEMHAKPVGHGYVQATVEGANPFYPPGTSFRGHEFHYSGPFDPAAIETCIKLGPGAGLGHARDGLVYRNTLACYMHVHADGVMMWAHSMVSKAADYAARRRNRGPRGNRKSGPVSVVI